LIVDKDGDICPFSIFDIIASEIPAACPSSAAVKSRSRRRIRTLCPNAFSNGLALSCGALDAVVSSASGKVETDLTWSRKFGGMGDLVTCDMGLSSPFSDRTNDVLRRRFVESRSLCY
jgi:hypothetical protein